MTSSSSRIRGTFLATESKYSWILLFNHVVCTAIGTYLSQYSLHTSHDIVSIGCKVALGVASSMVALMHSDKFFVLISFTVPLLIAINPTSLSPDQLPYAACPIALYVLSQLSPVKNVPSKGSSQIPLIASLPLFLLILTGCSSMIRHNIESLFLFAPTMMLIAAAFYVYYQYHTKGAHKNGKLNLETTFVSNVVAVAVLTFTTLKIISEGDSSKVIVSVFPFLIGALVCVVNVASFSVVADVWYVVGTCQFHTISIDTACIGFYIILPSIVLISRFFDKYGTVVNRYIQMLSEHFTYLSDDNTAGSEMAVYTAFVSLIIVTIGIGLSIVQSHCPVAGHIFGRVYTHGQPNTKLLAISVDYKDLFFPNYAEDDRKRIFKMLSTWNCDADDKSKKRNEPIRASLNINVTASDLKTSPDHIKKLHDDGHEIVITIDDLEYASIKHAHDLEKNLVGETSSTWFHTGVTSKGASPRCHSLVSSLGMRSAMWSNFIGTRELNNIDVELLALEADMDLHRGGSIVYLKCSAEDVNAHAAALKRVLELISRKQFIPTKLSSVAKEQSMMDLH